MKTPLASPVARCIQRGGTLVGFVVGLLVGLGLALAVAVYVTRVPVPFVDRGLARDPAQDSQEAQRNQGWNPNAVLGNTPPPPSPPPTAAETSVAPSAPGTHPAAPAQARPSSVDPLGDFVQARTQVGTSQPTPTTAQVATPPAPTPSTAPVASTAADPFTYFVQVGAFRTDEDAQAQRAKLAMLGIEAQVSEREQSGRTVFRVRVGPFKQKAQAEAMQTDLQAQQIDAALVRVQP